MSIQLPANFVIDDRLIIAAVAALGLIIFLILAGRRLWGAARQASSQSSAAWVRPVLITCVPPVFALVLAVAATLIWPTLHITKDTFQTEIGIVPVQVSGQFGVFTVVYALCLIFVEKIVSQQLENSKAGGKVEGATVGAPVGKPALPPVTTKPDPKPFPPDPRNLLPPKGNSS